MDLPFHEILTSPIFLFRIGPNGTEMRLPKVLVSQCSPVLEKLINGEMVEAQSGAADIIDVDESTFTRFAKWLYTGRHDVHQVVQPKPRSLSELYDPWDHDLSIKAKKKKGISAKSQATPPGSKRQEAWEVFTQHSDHRPSVPPRNNEAADYPDIADELLIDAKLYCFADKYAITALMHLCLENLKNSLINCECQSHQIRGIAELVAFVATNTPPLNLDNPDSLRAVVLGFAIIIFEFLTDDEVFQQVLEHGNDIVRELLLLLRQRLD